MGESGLRVIWERNVPIGADIFAGVFSAPVPHLKNQTCDHSVPKIPRGLAGIGLAWPSRSCA